MILQCSLAGRVLLSKTAGGACLFVIIYVGCCEARVTTGLGGSFTWPMFGGGAVDNVDLQSWANESLNQRSANIAK